MKTYLFSFLFVATIALAAPRIIQSPSDDGVVIDGGTTGVTLKGNVETDSPLKVDTINEKTTDAGVTVDGVLLKDSKAKVNNIQLSTNGVAISNGVDVSGKSYLVFGTSTGTITNLTGGETGQMLFLSGTTNNASVTLQNYTGSEPNQPFLCPANTDLTISGGYGGAVLFFTGTFWKVIATSN